MNLLLMRADYPPAIIRVDDRPAYYDALDAAHKKDMEPFVRLVAEAAERSPDTWLAAVGDHD